MSSEKIVNSKEGIGIKTAVDVVIFNEKNQVLLGKRLASAGFGSWGFPGGHIERDEKIHDCARRELGEELGKDVQIALTDEVLAVRENAIPPHFVHHLTVLIKGKYIKGVVKVNEPESCERWEWFDLDNLPQELFSCVNEVLENYKKNAALIVTDWRK